MDLWEKKCYGWIKSHVNIHHHDNWTNSTDGDCVIHLKALGKTSELGLFCQTELTDMLDINLRCTLYSFRWKPVTSNQSEINDISERLRPCLGNSCLSSMMVH